MKVRSFSPAQIMIKLSIFCTISFLAFSRVSGNTLCKDALTKEQIAEGLAAGLARHNLLRCTHGGPPLVLDDSISKVAQAYAEKIAAAGKFEHSGNPSYGESLAYSSSSKPPDASALMLKGVNGWYSEVKDYKSRKDWQTTGHFTALVWKATTKVGLGIAISSKGTCGKGKNEVYIVANYAPAGNMQSDAEYNKNVEGKPSKSEGDCAASTGASKSAAKTVQKAREGVDTEPAAPTGAPATTQPSTTTTTKKSSKTADSKASCRTVFSYYLICTSALVSMYMMY